METFRCTGCGKIMETIPQCCSQISLSAIWVITVDI